MSEETCRIERDMKKIMEKYIESRNLGQILSSDKQCIICLEEGSLRTMYKLDCSHMFCKSCIYSWLELHNKCPTCRCVIHDDKHLYKYIRKNIITNMEDTMAYLQILERVEWGEGENHPMYEDGIVNFYLDKILKCLGEYNINGAVLSDFLDMKIGDVVCLNDGFQHVVGYVHEFLVNRVQFITDNLETNSISMWSFQAEDLILPEEYTQRGDYQKLTFNDKIYYIHKDHLQIVQQSMSD